MVELLADDPGGIYHVGAAESLANALTACLAEPRPGRVESWRALAERMTVSL
jgi:hypothetical protein